MKKRFVLFTLLLLGTARFAVAADGWLTDFEKAKQESAARGVPILADFAGSDWCHWCMKLDQEVFSRPEFQSYAATNLVLFLADFPNSKPQTDALKQQNQMLAGLYGIQGYPTVLLLDKEGKVLGRTGYQAGGAAAYVKHIQSILK
jgi:protein disulfide-isomerase